MTVEDTTSPAPPPWPKIRIGGPAGKLALVGLLLIAMLIPNILISDVIGEREGRQAAVQEEIGASWGQPQTLLGPVLVLPYRTPVKNEAGETLRWRRAALAVLPATLRTTAELAPETRRRGVFETVVYGATVAMDGNFVLPALLPPEERAEFLWREAFVLAGSNDLRLADAAPDLGWTGARLTAADIAVDPELCAPGDTLRWPLGLQGPLAEGANLPFDLRLALRGTQRFRLLPQARRVELAIAAPWATPSFAGADLPTRSDVSPAGFRAEWLTGTRQPLVRRSLDACAAYFQPRSSIGVDLLEAVPTYRMVNRASKYGMVFVALAFATYVLFELLAALRIHIVNYALLGCSVVLFPLLLLAIGEPLGFGVAYAISTAAVMAQASAYTASVTGRWGLAAVFAGVLAALFGFLYVVLSLEAYSLLVGALALFAVLSVVMAVTRRVSWNGG